MKFNLLKYKGVSGGQHPSILNAIIRDHLSEGINCEVANLTNQVTQSLERPTTSHSHSTS